MIQGGLRVGIRSTLGTDHDADSLKLSIPQPQFLRNRYGKRDVILDKDKNPTKLCLTELFLVVKVLKCENIYNPVRNFFLNLMGQVINVQARVTILTSEQYDRLILPIIHHGYILQNGGVVLEGNSQELMDNPDIKSAYFGLQVPARTIRLLIGEGLMDLRFLGDDLPKKKDKGNETHS